MSIAYCVTTVPERRHTTLPETLSSLSNAGFDSPILFVDGDPADAEYGDLGLPVAFRELEGLRIKAFGNFVLACWELYIRSPQSDYYFIFQDDVKLGFTLDWFLEESRQIESQHQNFYLNFYTTSETWRVVGRNRQPPTIPELGWGQSAQRTQGALALCFPNRAMRVLLSSKRMTMNCLDPAIGRQNIDGTVSEAMRDSQFVELCHIPSLVYHLGYESAIGHGKRPQADPWWGVNWMDKITSGSGDDASICDQLPTSRAVHSPDSPVAL